MLLVVYIAILTKLFDVAQSLELRSVHKSHHQWMQFNGPMDGVIEHLVQFIHTT